MKLRRARLAIVGATAAIGLTAGIAGTALAGQPGAAAGNECREPTSALPAEMTPGKSISAGGSPFNPEGRAGEVYAGNEGTASTEHSKSGRAQSQYDIACVNVTRAGSGSK